MQPFAPAQHSPNVGHAVLQLPTAPCQEGAAPRGAEMSLPHSSCSQCLSEPAGRGRWCRPQDHPQHSAPAPHSGPHPRLSPLGPTAASLPWPHTAQLAHGKPPAATAPARTPHKAPASQAHTVCRTECSAEPGVPNSHRGAQRLGNFSSRKQFEPQFQPCKGKFLPKQPQSSGWAAYPHTRGYGGTPAGEELAKHHFLSQPGGEAVRAALPEGIRAPRSGAGAEVHSPGKQSAGGAAGGHQAGLVSP